MIQSSKRKQADSISILNLFQMSFVSLLKKHCFDSDCQLVEVSDLAKEEDVQRKLFVETLKVLKLDQNTFY